MVLFSGEINLVCTLYVSELVKTYQNVKGCIHQADIGHWTLVKYYVAVVLVAYLLCLLCSDSGTDSSDLMLMYT